MAIYILIDHASGNVFADTRDMDGQQVPVATAQEAVAALNALMGSTGGFHAFRADWQGSEAVPVVIDGQDTATIREIERRCKYEGFVTA